MVDSKWRKKIQQLRAKTQILVGLYLPYHAEAKTLSVEFIVTVAVVPDVAQVNNDKKMMHFGTILSLLSFCDPQV